LGKGYGDVLAAEYADAASKRFSAFGQDPCASPVLKGKVNFWLKSVYTQFDSVKQFAPLASV
jgi:hypothetical protein